MTKSIYGFVAAVLIAVFPAYQARAADEVAEMRGKYDERLKEIDTDAAAMRQKVLKKYRSELISVERKVKRKGDLDGLLVIRAEAERFAAQGNLAVANAVAQPDELRSVQEFYLKYLNAISLDRARDIKKLWQQYDAALATLEKKYTMQGKVETALAVRAERDRVEKSAELISTKEILDNHNNEADPEPKLKENQSGRLTLGPSIFEGFGEIISSSNSGVSNSYRDEKVISFWAYAGEGQHIEWKTEKVSVLGLKHEYEFVWGGGCHNTISDFELIFNGQKLLVFNSGTKSSATWKGKDATLKFYYVRDYLGYVGFYKLIVPSSLVKRGNVQKIRIQSIVNEKSQVFMKVNGFTDVVKDVE